MRDTFEIEEIKGIVFTVIQNYLKMPPVIIWGSGATVPYGLPSMNALNKILKDNIPEFDKDCDNLEVELGKEKYHDLMPQIRNLIWNAVSTVDNEVLQNHLLFKGIKKLVEKISDAHPKVANIITTNYDRIIENVLSFHGIHFTDGFLGRELSFFDESLFSSKNIVNIVKVHGSLNWFDFGGEIRYLQKNIENSVPQIICPGKNKYQEAYKSPYRELIQKSDLFINSAESFLVVGFGFNDEHLTPRIKSKIKKGTPIVVITKIISETCLSELESAEKYVLLEDNGDNNTRATIKERNTEKQIFILEGNFWSLNNFVDII